MNLLGIELCEKNKWILKLKKKIIMWIEQRIGLTSVRP